jgi:adenosylhomocysteinase
VTDIAAVPATSPTLSPVHQIMFQGEAADVESARGHLLTQLSKRGCSFRSTSAPSRDQVLLRLPGGGNGWLTIGAALHSTATEAGTVIMALTITDPGQAAPNDLAGLLRTLDQLPLTDWEVNRVVEQMPVMRCQAGHLGADAFSGLSIVCAIHHMRDFTAMVCALIACGADPGKMTIIDKGYPYPRRDRVDAWLRHRLGATVVPYPERAAGITSHLDRAATAGTPVLVFDDGGYVLPVVLDNDARRAGQIIGVVEQTMSGIWKLVPYQDLPIPVFSVAESALKAAVEAPYVAKAAIQSVVDRLPDETWAGRPALVLGYGRIGRQAAQLLRTHQRMRVGVYDTDPVALVTAHQDGFLVNRDLAALIHQHRPLLVLGCAGRGSLGAEHIAAFRTSAYLASMTSRDYEFPLAALATKADRVIDYGRLGHGYLLADSVELCVVGDGLPVNFHHRESVPNRVIDLVFAALLLGGATLAQPDHGGHPAGRDVALVNDILATSPALSSYLDLYAEDTVTRQLLTPPHDGCPSYGGTRWAYSSP